MKRKVPTSPQYDITSWPACWVIDLIAHDNIEAFYTSKEWRRARRTAMRHQHGECAVCARKGKQVRANTMHHVNRLRERPDLALSEYDERGKLNLMALCSSCHWDEHHARPEFTNEERW